MATARITDPSAGTVRLWNDIIAQYYEYDSRPEFKRNDDGLLEATVQRECAEALAEANDRIEHVEASDAEDGEADADDSSGVVSGEAAVSVSSKDESGSDDADADTTEDN